MYNINKKFSIRYLSFLQVVAYLIMPGWVFAHGNISNQNLKGLKPPIIVGLSSGKSPIVVDQKAAIQLGKALFWDMNVGSDGVACASCHFHAGADRRTRNQLNSGMLHTVDPSTANNFNINYPPWRTGLNITIIFLTPLLVYFFNIFYKKNRIKKIRQEGEIIRERNFLKLQALFAQMSPHFTFNVLNSLQGLVLKNVLCSYFINIV